MTLSCSCEGFDKGDHKSWWEPGGSAIPPPGTRCCECDAPLPADPCATILTGEVYEPEDEPPPEDANLWPRLQGSYWQGLPTCSILERHGEQMEQAVDDWRHAHGWDSDYERFEHYTTDYRCERCEGLAESIEDLGYCMIAPGELIGAHPALAGHHSLRVLMPEAPDEVAATTFRMDDYDRRKLANESYWHETKHIWIERLGLFVMGRAWAETREVAA